MTRWRADRDGRKTRGDTIVEVLIAIVIVSYAMSVAYVIANHSVRSVRDTQEHQEALSLASAQIENLRQNAGLQTDSYDCFGFDSKPAASTDAGCAFDSNGLPGCTPDTNQYCYNVTVTTAETTTIGTGELTKYKININWPSLLSQNGNEDFFYRIGTLDASTPTPPPPPGPPVPPAPTECKPGILIGDPLCYNYYCDNTQFVITQDKPSLSATISNFSAASDNPTQGTPQTVKVNWDDGTIEVFPYASVIGQSHTYSTTGTYKITATAQYTVASPQCIKTVTYPKVVTPFSPCVGDYIVNFMTDTQLKTPSEANLSPTDLSWQVYGPRSEPDPTRTVTPSGLVLPKGIYAVEVLSFEDHNKNAVSLSTDTRPISARGTDFEGAQESYEQYDVTIYDSNGKHTTGYTSDIPDNQNIGIWVSANTSLMGPVSKLVLTHTHSRELGINGWYGEGVSPVCISFTKIR